MLEDTLPDREGRDPNWRVIGAVTTAVFVVVLVSALVLDVAVPDRGVGLFDALSAQMGAVLTVAGVITQLGDPWFLLLTATFVYLAGTERSMLEEPYEGAFVLAVTFGAFSFVDLLKNVFAAPRPPGAGTVTLPAWLPGGLGGAFRSVTTGTGFAFPSGHALGTTAVFAALAYALDVGTPPTRWSAAAVGVSLVAASRIVLGVHFLVDVVVGVLGGLSLFAAAAAVDGRRPLRTFALAAGLGVLAVVASAATSAGEVWKAGQWLGASVGAGAAWYAVRPSTELDLRGTLLAAVPIAALWVAVYRTSPPLVVTLVGTAVAAGVTIAAPSVAARVEESA